jgi:1-aminocyclopropane-1-carboxylate deaminase
VDLVSHIAPTPLTEISNAIIETAGVRIYVKRDDLIHPTVSGNKWRKLKYNLLQAKEDHVTTILTFGGSYSNHLFATAAAGNALNFKTIGIVRGEDFVQNETPTLKFCREQNMELHFVSRQEYKLRNAPDYLHQISEKFNFPLIIPEGGTTDLALKGVAEMVGEVNEQLGETPDYFAVAAGTGGTAAGILSAGSNVLAFSVLKGGAFLKDDIDSLLTNNDHIGQLELFTDYHFGGYAKWNVELIDFMDHFKDQFNIQLEQVYTAKMFYGLFDLIKKGHFQQGTSIVAVHTGGLQGLLVR